MSLGSCTPLSSWAGYKPLIREGAIKVPLGRLIGLYPIFITRADAQLCATGMPGEICVTEEVLERGGIDRKELGASDFIPHPFKLRARLYRTGHIGRWQPDGQLAFLGSKASAPEPGQAEQIKALELALAVHPAIREVSVFADPANGGGVIVYVLPRNVRINSPYAHALPNGCEIIRQSRFETDVLYQEIFVQETYLQHGITLPQDACIFDVGANIGMFSVYAASRCPLGKVYAFEPMPPTYSCLVLNTAGSPAAVATFNIALGASNGAVEFSFYPMRPTNSAMSTYVDHDGDLARLKQFLRKRLGSEAESASEGRFVEIDRQLEVEHRAESVMTTVRRLSDVMREENIARIDLLKIDVERAEMDVLRGIDASDWKKIEQVVLEAHDAERAQEVVATLETHGFSVICEEHQLFSEMGCSNIYAKKRLLAPRNQPSPPPTVSASLTAADLQAYLREHARGVTIAANVVIAGN